MFPYCMPFLIINLGGEMLYILQQRLKAQNIDESKSKKVMEEVTTSMLKRSFVIELSKPQPIYSTMSTKEVFDRLAHSSIMKLSENSMSKLYDLMCMGFKYQILLCFNPKELVQVTYTHLDVMMKFVPKSKSVEMMKKRIQEIVDNMETEDFFHLKEELLDFFKDRNVKVGVFLSKDFQFRTGYFRLERPFSEFFHSHSEPLGTIEVYNEFGSNIISKETFDHPWKNVTSLKVNYLCKKQRTSPLGQTLYIKVEGEKGKKKSKRENRGKMKVEAHTHVEKGREFNYLASILGGVTSNSEETEGSFDLVFFENISDDEEEEMEGEDDGKMFSMERRDQVIVANSRNDISNLAKDFDLSGKKEIDDDDDDDDDDEDDLLSLLDGL